MCSCLVSSLSSVDLQFLSPLGEPCFHLEKQSLWLITRRNPWSKCHFGRFHSYDSLCHLSNLAQRRWPLSYLLCNAGTPWRSWLSAQKPSGAPALISGLLVFECFQVENWSESCWFADLVPLGVGTSCLGTLDPLDYWQFMPVAVRHKIVYNRCPLKYEVVYRVKCFIERIRSSFNLLRSVL